MEDLQKDLQQQLSQQKLEDISATNNFSLLQQVAAAAVAVQQQQLLLAAAQQQQQQEIIAKVAEVAAAQQNQIAASTSATAAALLVQQIVIQQAQLKQSESNNVLTMGSQEKLETIPSAKFEEVKQEQKRLLVSNIECPKSMRDAIFLGVAYAEAKIGQKMPYLLSLDDQLNITEREEQSDGDDVLITLNTPYRNRLRQITSDTYLCLNRLKPTINIHTENLSMYTHCWQPV